MRVLIVKLSSLGDVIHTFAAVQDAFEVDKTIEFHWVVEKAFAPLVACHPAIKKVIPIELRRWKKKPLEAFRSGEWKAFKQALKSVRYDKVIDAQGLLKSAWIACLAHGTRFGLDHRSAREPLASLVYQQKVEVPWSHHAVDRLRILFSKIFGYSIDGKPIYYGLEPPEVVKISNPSENKPYVMFFHGTTWDNKHWPVHHWKTLGQALNRQGYHVYLSWGTELERLRAEDIAASLELVRVLEKKSLPNLMVDISKASFCVAVDTGLGHLAAALAVPTLTLLGPTDPKATAAKGPYQEHLQVDGYNCSPCLKRVCQIEPSSAQVAPCMNHLTPVYVMDYLQKVWSAHGIYSKC